MIDNSKVKNEPACRQSILSIREMAISSLELVNPYKLN
jgi:hypothetical protein